MSQLLNSYLLYNVQVFQAQWIFDAFCYNFSPSDLLEQHPLYVLGPLELQIKRCL